MTRTTRFEYLVVDDRFIDRIAVLNMLETFINELPIVVLLAMRGHVKVEGIAGLSPVALNVEQQIAKAIYLWLAHMTPIIVSSMSNKSAKPKPAKQHNNKKSQAGISIIIPYGSHSHPSFDVDSSPLSLCSSALHMSNRCTAC
jgi:hypothetical protein